MLVSRTRPIASRRARNYNISVVRSSTFSILPTFLMSFQIWNQAIGKYWFDSRNSGRSIVLPADQTSLESAAIRSHILLEGKTAADRFVESVRLLGTWQRQELPADELPATSAYLALAILAVSYMDNASQQGMTSYWTPFKELYSCDVRDNQIPHELKSIWTTP